MVPLSKLIDFCTDSETSNLSYAESVFRQIHRPSVYIWNSMIKGYSNSDTPDESLLLYREMLQRGHSPDHFTFLFVLKDMRSGLKVFDEIPKWNVVAWTGLIAGSRDLGTGKLVHSRVRQLNYDPFVKL
ncbi:hypothetical protein EZV62_006840 [Acer yangbiense]|uniref:Pentatricopeptide repeat-containing protein n=1 Tax=Acer yangbiense TaxID=1000413 RepID=A0A5C7I8M7_9ROSI|nr:hypothetical protein EZV62_006840 [Acer yangbiense]